MVSGNYVESFARLGDSIANVENIPRPRYVKTHLGWDLLPTQIHQKKPKLIYVARNPKDTCVSFYHYCRLTHNIDGTFDEYASLFLEDHGKTKMKKCIIFVPQTKNHQFNPIFYLCKICIFVSPVF